jgi:hypothetical protein
MGDGAWEAKLAQLVAYKAARGDCNVPLRKRKRFYQGWADLRGPDPRLGRWVAKQRHNKKKLDLGEPSLQGSMTAERAARLTALGFEWEPGSIEACDAEWEAKLARLAAYKAARGDCNVLQRWAEDPWLGHWVHNQRKCKK